MTDGGIGPVQPDLELLDRIEQGMGITADLSRSDLLLLRFGLDNEFIVQAQARPHSIASLYSTRLVGQALSGSDYQAFQEAWHGRHHVKIHRDLLPSGAPVIQDLFPVFGRDGQQLALFSVELSQIQLERHRTRDKSFQRIIELLKLQCMRGELTSAANLSPFTEFDGVLLVDAQRRITYLSGIANNLYRRLGYLEDLRNKKLSFLNTTDDAMVVAAVNAAAPLESEVHEGSRVWVRKVLPVWDRPSSLRRLARFLDQDIPSREIRGVLIMVHDATEEQRKRQELKVKSTMIQEVHHRVKNNLQTVAAMLRMQARRIDEPQASQAIHDAISRIQSVAVIHEFLSRDESQSINIRDVCQRIISQNGQVSMAPGTQISFALEGPSIYLPSQQATACALVANELIQNAVEHGFEIKKQGEIRVCLTDGPDAVIIEVRDDGDRLPDEFELGSTGSLGLQIVRTLVEEDLHGSLTLTNEDGNVVATVRFPKLRLGHEES
jgi:two-component sensor histidine kinase/PAS domain-containing protein